MTGWYSVQKQVRFRSLLRSHSRLRWVHRHPHHDVGGWDHEHCEWVLKNLKQRNIVSILQYQGQNLSWLVKYQLLLLDRLLWWSKQISFDRTVFSSSFLAVIKEIGKTHFCAAADKRQKSGRFDLKYGHLHIVSFK